MEVARLVLDYLSLLVSFPVVVLVIALVIVRMFQAPLSDFLRRLVRGEALGVRLEAITPAEQLKEVQKTSPISGQSQVERHISKNPDQSAVERYISENPKEVLTAYQRVLNVYLFERAYNVIYGSQISLLECLQGGGDRGSKYVNLVPFFTNFTRESELTTTQFTDYIGFLTAYQFVTLSGEGADITAKITPLGVDFLSYIITMYPATYMLRPF